jgi:biopolymer transport protein ExbD
VARINVTPIIDVALVLVIILLITAPMLTVRDMGVELPAAQTRGPEDEARMALTVGLDGQIALDEDLVSRDQLVGAIQARLAGHEDMLVVVRADHASRYDEVEDLLRLAREAGARRIAVATRPGTEDAS